MTVVRKDIHGASGLQRKKLIPASLATAVAGALMSLLLAACGAAGPSGPGGPASTATATATATSPSPNASPAGNSDSVGGDSVPPPSATGSKPVGAGTPSLTLPPTAGSPSAIPGSCIPGPPTATPEPSGEVPPSPDCPSVSPTAPAGSQGDQPSDQPS